MSAISAGLTSSYNANGVVAPRDAHSGEDVRWRRGSAEAATAALDGLLAGVSDVLGADLLVAFTWRDDGTATVRAACPPLPPATAGLLTLDRAAVAAAGGVVLDTAAPHRWVPSALRGVLPGRPTAAWVVTAAAHGAAGAAAGVGGGLLAVWCGDRLPDPALADPARSARLRTAVAQAVAAVDDGAGTGVVNAVSDALRAAEARASAAVHERHALFGALRDVVLVFDRDGTYLRIIETAPDLTHRPSPTLVGRRLHDVFPAEQADESVAAIRRALDERRPVELEYVLDLPTGRAWFAGIGTPIGENAVLWVARDVTARREAEAERARLLAILAATPDLVSLATPDGRVVYVNQAVRDLLGVDADAVLTLGTLAAARPPAAAAQMHAEAIPAAVRNGHWRGESALVAADGRVVPVSQVIQAHYGADGAVEYLSTIIRDVTDQRRTEAALRASEARFRAAMAASPDACFLFETVRGADGAVADFCFVEANAQAGALYGIPPEDLPGQALCELFPLFRGSALLAHYVHVVETGAPYEGEYLTRDPRARATWLWLQVVALRGDDGAVVGLAVTARDITARKAAEGERRLLHEVTVALGAAPDADGALGAALRAMCEATGLPYGEVWVPADAAPGTLVRGPAWYAPDDARLHGFDQASRACSFAPGHGLPGQAAAAGAPVWLPDVTAPDANFPRAAAARRAGLRAGLAVPILADGQVVAVFAFHLQHARAADTATLDRLAAVGAQIGAVVRRRQAEAALGAAAAALEREREFLAAVLEHLAEGVAACDADGRLTIFNRALRTYHGLPPAGDLAPDQWAGHYSLYRADGATPLAADEIPLARALGGEVVRGAELVVAPTGAAPRTFVASGRRVTGAGGRNLGAVVAMHDVTERVEAERRKSEFVSIVSHELRTPLTSIRGALGLLGGGVAGALPDRAAPLVRIATANVERLVRLVTDVLDLEKIDAGKLEYAIAPQDPADVVAAAADGIAGMAAAARVEVMTRVDTHAAVRGDRDRLLQVLTNLLSNAIKFSPPHSAVLVSAGDQADAAGRPGVRFAVEDYGPGIPPDKLGLLFQKFRQLDGSDSRRHGGTGLGLAISKAIVEQHGGRVGVASEPGRRTVFWFDLPARDA